MLQGFLVAAVSALIYLESRIGGQHMLDRPIIIGPVVGLIMGDFQSGLFIGGQLELVWMGLVGIGTSTPPDVVVGSALATALAIKTGATYETTLALAIPIALLAQLVSIGVCILNTAFAHKADACAEKGD
ncbi:MAG: PTS sugar transporter subunit IIC, partial [Anaerorhabdus sp.]